MALSAVNTGETMVDRRRRRIFCVFSYHSLHSLCVPSYLSRVSEWRWALSSGYLAERALSRCKQVSIRMNEWGYLSMQFRMITEDDQSVFTELLCLPQAFDDDDDEGDEEQSLLSQ